jgi:hypothetical protein
MLRLRTAALAFLPFLASALEPHLHAQDARLELAEAYALAEDRAAFVATLLPGSEEAFELGCREAQARGDFDAVPPLLAAWSARHGRTPAVIEAENRQALLTFGRDPGATFAFLRERLGLRFDERGEAQAENADMPTRLDPALLTRAAWSARARAAHPGSLSGFQPSALAWLAETELDDRLLRELLDRLERPDLPGLPALVARELAAPMSPGFGKLGIHGKLLLEPLEELARLRPPLLQEPEFVAAWLRRLAPGADSGWRHDPPSHDPGELEAYLERLWAFARGLPPVHNSLKAHVLYHRLALDLTRGAPDRERLDAYLRLPRRGPHVVPAYRDGFERRQQADLDQRFETDLPSIDDDEALLRACFEHVYADEVELGKYAEFLDADWLREVLAETRLLAGAPEAERWSALLGDPARVEALARRVELSFPPSARRFYAAREPVVLEADVKNVPTLVVKVFALDAFRYHVATDKEIDESIELDGLVANLEQTFRYDDAPMRRVRRRFELPILSGPGTFVVELVGNGLRSRAVIHKGFLRHVETSGAAGHVFSVFDEAGARLADASVWTGGREYTADARGEIVVPYSTDPGKRAVVLRHGERSTLASFDQEREEYTLGVSSHLDREALISGARARLVLRPELQLGGRPIALGLLADPVLTLVAADLDGLETTQEVRGLALVDERELVHELAVPERLAWIRVSLRGSVQDLGGKRVELVGGIDSFPVNDIDATSATASPQLLRTEAGYVVEVRGKDGEPRAGRPVTLSLTASDFTDPHELTLQTDAAGRIELGALEGIASVGMRTGSFSGEVRLRSAYCSFSSLMHGLAGETLRVPYLGTATAPTRAAFSLLGEARDAFEHLALADGFLELRGLAAGDYELRLHESGTRIRVVVTRGVADKGWLIGHERILERTPSTPLHVRSLAVAGGELRILVANPTPSTRLVVVATRALPPYGLYPQLASGRDWPREFWADGAESLYRGGLPLGEELRYVLERRFAPKHPGNMLRRPSLLLNPLDLAEADVGRGSRSAFASRRAGRGGKGGGGLGQGAGAGAGPSQARSSSLHPGVFASLDYLPSPSVTLANLEPDASGFVRVPLAELGAGQLVHVLALDGEQAVYRTLVRPEVPLVPRPRHLAAALDPAEHSAEQRRIELVSAGASVVIDDARTTKTARLDSLASVHRLLLSIRVDADLARFEFVVRWPSLTRAEKLELYARHACHELHFFLFQKDPVFFGEVVRPFLANKLHKTFLDHWLLGDDLRGYLEPWAFGRLNLIERILLARRLEPAEAAPILRLVEEAHALRPPERARLQRLFELALANDALSPPAASPEASKKPEEERKAREAEPEEPEAEESTAGTGIGVGESLVRDFDVLAERSLDAERRSQVRSLYRPLEPTRAYLEHDYWHRAPRPDDSFAALVPASAFWRDYALAPRGRPFVSTAVAEASASFLEAMFALAVLDLPFAPGEHGLVRDGSRTTLTAATPLLLVRKETAPVAAAGAAAALLVGENFLRLDARTEVVDGEPRDRFVTDEFLSDVAYACQVVVSNPTSGPRAVELLLQIPAGSVPVQKGFWTGGQSVELGPYATKVLEYAFYFPASGDFAHYPVHAAEKGALAGAAAARTLHVVERPTRVDTSSWEHVAASGSASEVLAHLAAANVQALDLGRIAWRLRDPEFFAAVVEHLRARHVYDARTWSYGLFHGDLRTTREYLEHRDAFVRSCGAYLDSPLLRIDPIVRNEYLHLELDPLVHARAHPRGRLNVGTNAGLAQQYRAFLDVLGHKPRLDDEDWAMATYYLLLQDRVDDALAAFARVDPARLESRLQHDYLAAYLCFFTGDVARARALAEPHREHPVAHWRERFAAVLSQLDEAAGKVPATEGVAGQDQLAASEPALELAGEGRALAIRYRNLARCEVRYYPLDVEVAFSARPFATAEGGAAAYLQPLSARTVELPPGKAELALALPAELRTANVLVEVRAGGLSRARTLYANALDVRFLEAYGQVAVSDPARGTPLPQVYVKCFARLPDGTVRFHKDGYTDLRGRFDYASVSNDPDLEAERYAVLVLSDELGADLRELAPPAR